jgi:hypothetical protein
MLRRLSGWDQKEMSRKLEKQQSVSPSRQRSITPVGFGQGFHNNNQCDNNGAYPHTVLDWLQLIFKRSLKLNQH